MVFETYNVILLNQAPTRMCQHIFPKQYCHIVSRYLGRSFAQPQVSGGILSQVVLGMTCWC